MPKVNGEQWKIARYELDISSDQAAARLKISPGHLRNIEISQVMASERLIRRAARLYGVDYGLLVAGEDNDGVPDEPPEQPKPDKTGPAPRKDREAGKTSPKRVKGVAA